MKISYNRLKQLIKTDLSVNQIAEILTNTGLEVEHIENYQSIPGGLQGIVIGHVLETVKHPNADKLKVCRVDLGSEIKQIVCGAANVAAGQKVLVATVGSTVHPINGKPFEIQKAKIRGEVSEGMICAEDELSLGQSHDGIMVLPEHYETGKPAAEYFNIYTDQIIEIGLTANRGDAASHLGVARDIKAATGCEIILPEPILPQAQQKTDFKVTIEDTEGCKRYSGLYITGVSVQPSPDWLQQFLLAIGLSPINNIVDATNYVLHSLGQPLHAFDADLIKDNHIVVKRLEPNTIFTTLDKTERKLNGEECMICDTEKPLALAGIFGGLQSGISNQTKNIFIESAYFNSATIRKAAKHHGLNTDASFRYERGTDPNITIFALKTVAQLILEIAGGKVSSDIIDVYPNRVEDRKIEFSVTKHNQLLGHEMPLETILQILNRLDIKVENQSEDILHLVVPPYRVDVERAVDVSEELLRIYGLNNIPIGNSIKSAMTHSNFEFGLKLKNKIAAFLSANGFNEIATNSLTKAIYTNNNETTVKLLNPLSSDLECMRSDMLYSMLESIAYNNNRKQNQLNFFEFGKTYHLTGNPNELGSYIEKKHLAIAIFGNKHPESWNLTSTPNDFYRLKQIAEKVLHLCGINGFNYLFEPNKNYDVSAQISINNNVLAQLGSIQKNILKQFDIEKQVWYIDFDVDILTKLAQQQKFKLKPVSVFPFVRRDLALVIDKHVTYAQLFEIAQKTEPNLLKDVNVFDVYEGEKIAPNKKSYALSFILQDEDKTLTDDVIDATMQKLLKAFEKHAGALLR